MLYVIKSAHLIEKSENIFENDKYCSAFKVGYTKEIDSRYTTYKTENIGCDLIKSRVGDQEEEYILHLILRGLGLNLDKGREWYKLDPKVIEIFDKPIDELKKMLWENRDKYFPKGIFTVPCRGKNKEFKCMGHKIFSDLYKCFVKENEVEFYGLEYYIDSSNNPVKNENFQNIDGQYLELILQEVTLDDSPNEESARPDSPESKIVSEFLTDRFYSTGKFKERMKAYCKFRDEYENSPEVISELNRKIGDLRFLRYYEYYGSHGCGSRQYEEKKLLEGLKSKTKLNTIGDHIYSLFEIGKKYSMFEIKEDLVKLFKEVGITDKKPTSTLLQDYFEMSRTKITLPDKTLVNGFKILGRKDGVD